MINLNNYENIIFDFGGVILEFDEKLTLKEFENLSKKKIHDSCWRGKQKEVFDSFEMGKISLIEFRKSINNLLEMNLKNEDIDQAWNSMLIKIPYEKLEFINKLKSRKKVFLLSNTNILHEGVFCKMLKQEGRGKLEDYFHDVYYSHRIGIRKPFEEAFKYVVERNSLDKVRTIFIDDTKEHIKGAQKYGLSTYHLNPNEENIIDIFIN